MKQIGIVFTLVLLTVVWRGCSSTIGMEIEMRRPLGFELESYVPAGDSLVDRPVLIRKEKRLLAEYPARVVVPHQRSEERWSADSPSVATVKKGGVIHGHRPGWATFRLRLRDLEQELRVRVGFPMDSIVMRFAAREAMVGDTIELFYRRFYADGSEESAHAWSVDPDDRDRNGIPRGQHVYVPASDGALAGDTIRFWLRRPGTMHVKGVTHGRVVTDSLRIVPSLGRAPRLLKAPWGGPQPQRRDRRPFRCYQLQFGTWSNRRIRLDQKSFAYLPSAIELDSTGIIPGSPQYGLRINAVRGGRIETPRAWRPLRADSALLMFETADGVSPHYRVNARLSLEGDTVTGHAEEGGSTTEFVARRIACN